MKKLLVIGAGGHGMVVKETAEAIGYDKVDFVDDASSIAIGKVSDLANFVDEYKEAFVGIGNNNFRKTLLDKLEQYGYSVPVLIHPAAYVSKSARIEVGTIIEPMAIVNANSKVGKGCIISVGAIVDHDVELQYCVHVNAGAICKAGSKVEECRKLQAGEVVLGY